MLHEFCACPVNQFIMATGSYADNMLGISWQDSNWISILNPGNVMDYFSERSNPFYDRQCNNESIKMQRLSPDQLNNMVGIEYILLHAQEPILYIIRKQHRHSPTQVTPLADYYMIAGVVYQAPDLCSVINSRLLNTTFRLSSAFEEAMTYVSYHPSKGYSWDFKDKNKDGADKGETKDKKKEERSSLFQRQRVDLLLTELSKKYPLLQPPAPQPEPKEEPVKTETKVEVKTEKTEDKQAMRPPPEKKAKLMR